MVMHARKPQRLNDGYFEKHQPTSYQNSKYSSKRDYERDRSCSYREHDLSPGIGSGSGLLKNGNNSSYRSQSPEINSPSSRGHTSSHDIRDRVDHRGGGGGGSSDRYAYVQKMRDRDREIYKKDKYSDKRERRGGIDRDSDSSYRTNHERIDRRTGSAAGSSSSSGLKLCSVSSSGEKRAPSTDRERERDRERDLRDSRRERDSLRDRDRERDRERSLRGDERERDRGNSGTSSNISSIERNDRGERIARCGDWSEHVSSSGKMYYYNCKTEVSQWEKPKEWIERERSLAREQHRERDYRDKERDRDREDRYSRPGYTKHSSSRNNTRLRWNYDNDAGPPSNRRRADDRIIESTDMDISPGDSTPTSEASYSLTGTPTTHGVTTMDGCNAVQHNEQVHLSTVGLPNALPRLASHPNATVSAASSSMTTFNAHTVTTASTSLQSTGVLSNNISLRKSDALSMQYHPTQMTTASPKTALTTTSNCLDHPSVLSTSGPSSKTSSKDPALILRHQHLHHHSNIADGQNTLTAGVSEMSNHINPVGATIRENALNSPLYNLTHPPRGVSPMTYTKSPITHIPTSNAVGISTLPHNSTSTACTATYSSSNSYALKTVDGNASSSNSTHCNAASSSSIQPASHAAANCSSNSTSSGTSNNANTGNLPTEGPPTPTQELDISAGSSTEQQQRKLDSSSSGSASLSTLQGCVSNSIQSNRCQGPDISSILSKYFRSDLISHVSNWPAEQLEKQTQKCSEDSHLYGDIQCTKFSAELKCARSLVRITEITAILQEQKLMYLRQQIRNIEESKSQNSFMSEDP